MPIGLGRRLEVCRIFMTILDKCFVTKSKRLLQSVSQAFTNMPPPHAASQTEGE